MASNRQWGNHTGSTGVPVASTSASSSSAASQQRHPAPCGNISCQSATGSDVAKAMAAAACTKGVTPFMLQPQIQERLSDGSARFKLCRYPGEMLNALQTLRTDGSLCDVTLRTAGDDYGGGCAASSQTGVVVHAHKVILAGCSLYFRGMFTRGMRETNMSEVCIRESNVTGQALRTLVDFAYTGEVVVSQHNAQELLMAAIFLEVRPVIEACTLYLEQQLDPANCVGMMDFARAHGCLDLEVKARRFIYDHFCEVVRNDEILELSAEDIADIVQQEDININCESEVFSAVVRWADHSPEHRVEQLESLLSRGVRLCSLAPAYLEDQLQRCHLIRRQPRCYRLLLDSLRRLTQHTSKKKPACPGGAGIPDRGASTSTGAGCSGTAGMEAVEAVVVEPPPRRPGGQRVIYSAGGFYRKVMDSLKSFECYDPSTKEWTRLPDLPRPRCGPGVTALQGCIYVVGGRVMQCGGAHTDTCSLDVYDPRENKWSTRCHMHQARSRVGVAVLDGMIYAVGGSAGGELHKSVERYAPASDEWEFVASLQEARISAGVAVVNRIIYVMGGFDGRRRLNSVQCYNPERNCWEQAQSMRRARSGAGVTVLRGQIYAVGGFDGSSQLTSVERYDPAREMWEEVAPLLKARSAMGVAVIDDKLYALGGFDGSDFLSCVESYDPDTDSWRLETNMLCERSGHGVAVERMPTLS